MNYWKNFVVVVLSVWTGVLLAGCQDEGGACANDLDCPGLEMCIDGECRIESTTCPQVPCEAGEVCVEDHCYPEDCETYHCPGSGEVCIGDECVRLSCVGIECADAEVCVGGHCYPEDCETHPCPGSGDICIEDECVPLCEKMECAEVEVCVGGHCYPEDCETHICPGSGEICIEDECVPLCVGVECSDGQTCVEGTCYPNACADQACDANEVCFQHECVDTECLDLGGVIVCEEVPDDFCNDDVLRIYDDLGECREGECVYSFSEEICPSGCLDAACLSCQPDCTQVECGPDPVCGESCGDCQGGGLCSVDGVCIHFNFEWVEILPGDFVMGSPIGEPGRDFYTGQWPTLDETAHSVSLSHGFVIADREVSQGDFVAMMGYNPSHFLSCGLTCPVEDLTFYEAALFCNRLSEAFGLQSCFSCGGSGSSVNCDFSGNFGSPYDCPGYRLPTEAEWEYAARAGTQTAFSNGSLTHSECSPLDANLDELGWYWANSSVSYEDATVIPCDGLDKNVGPHPTGQKSYNPWGLYDMNGNVWEWVMDCPYSYPTGQEIDPVGPLGCDAPIYRGGSYGALALYCRNAERATEPCHGTTCGDIGFRPVRSIVTVRN
ncbi:MAG: formylglycine-generating enzyme family protein [Deltaproteobacteria bacterium]|nr:formylglycine-generating enzyme family protein [Deltaproteobacteria bacterium]